MTPNPVIASEARQSMQSEFMDCHVVPPRNDGPSLVIANEVRQSMNPCRDENIQAVFISIDSSSRKPHKR
jgi:hypothetical protein